MTAGELILELEQFHPNMEVRFAYPSGSYWQTVIAEDIRMLDIELVSFDSYYSNYIIDSEGNECIILRP
jgi:hypothetical protein